MFAVYDTGIIRMEFGFERILAERIYTIKEKMHTYISIKICGILNFEK